LHHSKLPQATWFWAAYSNGISALATATPARSRLVQIGLADLRQAAPQHGGTEPQSLAGLVEVDETEIAWRSKYGPVTGGVGRSHQGKIIVVGAVEDGGPGRIRLAEVPDYSADSLHPFIAGYLTPGATAKTEGWSTYPLLRASLKIRTHRQDRRTCRPTWVHRIFSNLKVWALDVYHGLRRPHPQSYLDGFVFRFNAAFQSLLSIAAAGRAPLTYKHADLTGNKAINHQIRNEPIHRIRSTFRARGIALWDRRRSAFGSFPVQTHANGTVKLARLAWSWVVG
jgi:ISXO2-like transposase domain